MTPNPISDIARTSVDTAAKLSRISMDSAERAITVQLEYAKGAMAQAALTAQAVSQAKDVQELMSLRTRIAENTLENLMGYSRSLYEVASEAQAEYSRLAEERMAEFQRSVTATVEEAARSAPGGGDVAAAAIKSQLAAATAAFDSLAKAAKQAVSYAEAGVKAAGNGRAKK